MLVNTPGTIPSLTVAGRVFTDLSNLIVLYSAAAGAANGYTAPRRASGSAAYQVPAGKSFRILAVIVEVTNAVANSALTLGYQDTDTGVCTNTGPTGGVKIGNSDYLAYISQAAVGRVEYQLDFSVPTGKYLATYNSGTAASWNMKIYGYEV